MNNSRIQGGQASSLRNYRKPAGILEGTVGLRPADSAQNSLLKGRLTLSRLCAVLAVLISGAVICACGGGERSQFHTILESGWIYGDTLRFTPCDTDSMPIKTADIAVAVRHANSYEYANLWLQMRYIAPDSAERIDTFNIRLADKFGNWLGNGIGVSYQKIDTIVHGAVIDTRHPVEITHIMRIDTLPGIEQVGLVFSF